MKKIVLILSVLFILPFSTFSMANGAFISFQENIFYTGHDEKSGGASYTIKPDNTNLFLEVFTGWNFTKNSFSLSGIIDLRLFEAEILPNFNIYGNAGVKAGLDFYEGAKISAAPRIALGLNLIFLDGYLEIFLQQAVQQNVRYNFASGELDYPLELPLGLGFRIWD